jgi:predicted P-loop ATPase
VKTSDDEYWLFTLRKWLVALVAGASIDNVVNQTVLLFMGKQGLGKSMFFRSLIPGRLRDYISDTPLIPGNKDSDIQLAETLLIIMDEFADMLKHRNAAKKEMITKSEINIRRPYGRFSEKMIRHASLCGSANEMDILNDPTGSRRYLIHKVESINYTHGIDMNKVFSEAYHLLNNRFQYWFDQDEIRRVHKHNRQFEDQSMEEELILKYFESIEPNDPLATKYTASEIVEILHKNTGLPNSHSTKIKVGHALAKHNFQNKQINGLSR